MAGVDALVSFAVESLGNLLIEEVVFLGSVRGKVDEMKRELTRMQCFLTDADRRRVEGDASVINWLVEIRDLAYDAEEAIATFHVKVVGWRHSVPPVCFDFNRYFRSVKTCVTRRAVGKDIEEINGRIAGLTRSLQTYGVQPTAAAPTKPRITYYTSVEDNVVGLRDHVTTVVAHLKDKTHPRIISIWGTGGLGKTTFSKQIKRHGEIGHYFDHVAWVCVSQECNPHQVWTEILLQCVGEQEKAEVRSMTSNELVSKLDSLQMEKKCLVILDDIWKQEDWTSLSPAFPRSTGSGSKIMLTTRNQVVVSHADIGCFPYNLPLLSREECLQLLEKKVSPDVQGFGMSTEMKIIIEEIVGHCGGLPLAIVLIGGLLAKDKTLEGWEKVRRDLNNSFNKGDDRNGGVRDVLALSYRDLPYYLKSCFLYLSLFPEDHDIEAKSLVQMWIAEGFVSAARGELGSKTMLDVGLSYLNELVNRSMVQADITQFTKRVTSCRLHDLMHEFCKSMAQEEKFSEDLNLKHSVPSTGELSSSPIRRLAVYLNDDRKQQAAITNTIPRGQHQHVRSCLVHNWRNYGGVTDHYDKVKSLLRGFKFLKVFRLVGSPFSPCEEKLLKGIGKLNHLRHLCIRHGIRLPSSLGDLILLQTLDLRMNLDYVTEGMVIVPDVLWKLKGLIHLYLPEFDEYYTPKLRLDGLSKLETLVNFDTRCSDVTDLSTLPSLRKVRIRHCTIKYLANISEYPMFSKSTSLLQRSAFEIVGNAETQEEHSLLCRVLAYPHVTKFSLDGSAYEDTFLHNLSKNITLIVLEECGLKEDPMPALGELPHLRNLVLRGGSYIGKKMVCLARRKKTGTPSFPQLTFLAFYGLDISEWKVEEGTMPSLSTLIIVNCKELLQIPDGLKFIATLQTLEVWTTPELLKQRLQEGGEDFHIIQHIPRREIH